MIIPYDILMIIPYDTIKDLMVSDQVKNHDW